MTIAGVFMSSPPTPLPRSRHRRLLEDSDVDVRSFIKDSPFRPHASTTTTGTAVEDAPFASSSGEATFAAAGDEDETAATAPTATISGVDGVVVSPGGVVAPPSLSLSLSAATTTIMVGDGGGDGDGGDDGDARPTIDETTAPVPTTASTAAPAVSLEAEPCCLAATGVSLSDAVWVALTSGPLAPPRKRSQVKPATATAVADNPRKKRALYGSADTVERVFEGFGEDVEASVVGSVLELLQEACAAAERWGLSPRGREGLGAWSGVAAVSAASRVGK